MSSLQIYLKEFALRLTRTNLNEAQAISQFLGGLREEVEMFVRLFNRITLQSAYSLAKV